MWNTVQLPHPGLSPGGSGGGDCPQRLSPSSIDGGADGAGNHRREVWEAGSGCPGQAYANSGLLRPQYPQLYQDMLSQAEALGCLKVPREAPLLPRRSPPPSVDGPTWWPARNSRYCLTGKAASSAERGAPLPGTLCPYPCQSSSCDHSTCLDSHWRSFSWHPGRER